MRRAWPVVSALGVLALVILSVFSAMAAQPGNEHFQRTWERTDMPVLEGEVSRTWMWGPQANYPIMQEPYAESPNGTREVQYYDKARMEITHPDTGDPSSIWYVTNGLLVVELITGQLQVGDATFEPKIPAMVNVAGDFDDPNGPTYATFGSLLDATPATIGTTITKRVDRAGAVTDDPSLAGQGVTVAHLDEVTNHAIATPFWDFMNSSGIVHENGQNHEALLFESPVFATGRPITEAYWANVKVAGTYKDVLMQCFERRCLTYTPGNPDGFIVEAGNVGQHYHAWRYPETPDDEPPTATQTATPTATATATPTQTATPTATEEPAPEYAFSTAWGTAYAAATPLKSPVGAAVGEDDHLWVMDTYNHRLMEYDEHGVFIRSLGSQGQGTGQFQFPVDADVSDDGRLYVVDQGNHRVQIFSPEGTFLNEWGSEGTGNGQFDAPTGVTVHGQVVYVVDYLNGRVQYFDLAGTYQGQFGTGLFEDPAHLAIAPDGLIYVTDFKKHVVWKLNSNGSYAGQFGSEGAGNGQIKYPSGIDIDADGYIYVVDHGNDRIQKFSPAGNYLEQWGTNGYQPGQLFAPRGLAVDSLANVYVADQGNNRIQKLTSEGKFLFEVFDAKRGTFSVVVDVTADQDGNLLTLDGHDRLATISRYTPDGIPLDSYGRGRPEFSVYDNLAGVAVNLQNGEIYVTDRISNRVQRFSSTWQHLGSWGTPGSGPSQFNGPTGIAIDADGNVYVADTGNKRVQKFDATGAFLTEWGGAGAGDGQFEGPADIAIYGERVYVSDYINNRVQAFDRDGNYLTQWSSAGPDLGDLDSPQGLAVSPEGNVLVVDFGNSRLVAFSPEGEALTAFGQAGSGPGEFNVPYGIAADDAGNVYVTDISNYRVQKFTPVS